MNTLYIIFSLLGLAMLMIAYMIITAPEEPCHICGKNELDCTCKHFNPSL